MNPLHCNGTVLVRNSEGGIAKIWVKISEKGKVISLTGQTLSCALTRLSKIAVAVSQCVAQEQEIQVFH